MKTVWTLKPCEDSQAWGGVKGYPTGTLRRKYASGPRTRLRHLDPGGLKVIINPVRAARIKAPLIIEANELVTALTRCCADMGTVIIPDMYANAGGVTVSHFEGQNLSHIRFYHAAKKNRAMN
jgi:glutamate dehydrogenase (NAD(P)+)